MVVAPYSFANVEGSEIVRAKFELVGQLLSFESKLDTNAIAGKIVNSAMVNGRAMNRDFCREVSLGSLGSCFHLVIHP